MIADVMLKEYILCNFQFYDIIMYCLQYSNYACTTVPTVGQRSIIIQIII
jgi:hypothetical protein